MGEWVVEEEVARSAVETEFWEWETSILNGLF